MPISTFPRHHDYDEDEYLLKPAGLRDTRSEGKVTPHAYEAYSTTKAQSSWLKRARAAAAIWPSCSTASLPCS
jgi:hypothetical protein